MAHDSVDGTRGFPQYANTGAPADAADLSEIAAWAGANIDRIPLATVAALSSQSPLYTGRRESVSILPGCFFQYNGSTWDMVGTPIVANFAAIATAIPTPVVGWKIRAATEYFDRRWDGTNWSITGAAITTPSFTISGTGATLNGDGSISVSAMTAALKILNCNSPFKTVLEMYLPTSGTMLVQLADASGTAEASGTPGTSGNYERQLMSFSGAATPGAGQSLKQTSWLISNGAGPIHIFKTEIYGANAASVTEGFQESADGQNPMGASEVVTFMHLQHEQTVAYPSLVITPSSAMTGTIKVSQG